MAKKIIALLLFMILFATNAAYSFYEAGVLINSAQTKTYAVDSRVLFVQDYSKIISEVRQSMANPLAVFASNTVKNKTIAGAAAPEAFFVRNTYMMNMSERFAVLRTAYANVFQNGENLLKVLYVVLCVLSFMLLYIGLLRLFNAHIINKKYTFVKPGFTY